MGKVKLHFVYISEKKIAPVIEIDFYLTEDGSILIFKSRNPT